MHFFRKLKHFVRFSRFHTTGRSFARWLPSISFGGDDQNISRLGLGIIIALATLSNFDSTKCSDNIDPKSKQNVFRLKDVADHNNLHSRVWVYYEDGVYDVTDYIPNHPGGSRILLAAGKDSLALLNLQILVTYYFRG